MAGTQRGKIEQYLPEITPAANVRDIAITGFKNLFDFLEAHPITTRIALGYGIGGTGTDYPGGANPFGSLPFAVYRWDTHVNRDWVWYLFIAGGNDSSRSAAITEFRPRGGSPGSTDALVVCSAAVGVGGDGNPWNGTTNNDGTDTIPSPGADLWAVPSGGGTNVKVTPASNNNASGTPSPAKNDVFQIMDYLSGSNTPRMNFVADDDMLFCFTDEPDSGNHNKIVMVGAIDTVDPVAAGHPNPLIGINVFGGTSGTEWLVSQDYDGGITHFDDAETTWPTVKPQVATYLWMTLNGIFQPSLQGTSYYACRDAILLYDGDDGNQGLAGYTTLVQTIDGVASYDTDLTLDKIVVGSSSTTGLNFVAPWDGTTTPGTGTTRAGVNF